MDYNLEEAFAAIENELIESMMRNMKKHLEWEAEEGFDWAMWQAMQLESLERYKKANSKTFKKRFQHINLKIEDVIESAYQTGMMEQEIEILEAIQGGFKGERLKKFSGETELAAEFFKLNERKLQKLIDATIKDMEKAETAVLRMANDKYRQIIFNAQAYANTGAGTYEKAVDMATKDFLQAGLNCVEYTNGARHTLKDYAMMAIRTASKRAYLAGEGVKRQEWGISTVIINKRGNPCPKCLPFVGKIMIDDVWSGGKTSDGPYPLISSAIEAGLYHPNCKDSHTTYFPGITQSNSEKLSKEDIEEAKADYTADQKKGYIKRQEEKYVRLETYSFDEDNKKKYLSRRKDWEQNREKFDIMEQRRDYLKFEREGNLSSRLYGQIEQTATEALMRYPEKIKNVLKDYTIKVGSVVNGLDIERKELLLGQDLNTYIFDHEIGHLLEEQFIDSTKLDEIKKYIAKDKGIKDLFPTVMFDASGAPVTVLHIKHKDLFTDYQGRIYSDVLNDISELFDNHGQIRHELLWELVSETMPHYMNGEAAPNNTIKKVYELIEETLNEFT